MTAEDILRAAKEKFDATPTHNIGCISNCTGKCSAQGTSSASAINDFNMLSDCIINPKWAIYCASYNSSKNWSEHNAYSCPGHRNSNETNNRYPFPSDTDLSTTKIIYES